MKAYTIEIPALKTRNEAIQSLFKHVVVSQINSVNEELCGDEAEFVDQVRNISDLTKDHAGQCLLLFWGLLKDFQSIYKKNPSIFQDLTVDDWFYTDNIQEFETDLKTLLKIISQYVKDEEEDSEECISEAIERLENALEHENPSHSELIALSEVFKRYVQELDA